ncbi:UNVERIFIED_CONTAM: transmembrane protein, putative [Hammondia hammondi]|eukprot:XP_008889453.1 transmembrane protein, putative [Hammondia hammondi]
MKLSIAVLLIVLVVISEHPLEYVAADDPPAEQKEKVKDAKDLSEQELRLRFSKGVVPSVPSQTPPPPLRGGLLMGMALLSVLVLSPLPLTALLGTFATVEYLTSVYHRHRHRLDHDEAEEEYILLTNALKKLEIKEWRKMKKKLRQRKSEST